jgi:hypothetical protein
VLVNKGITGILMLLVITDFCLEVKLGSYSAEASEYLGNAGLTKSRLQT